MFCWEPTEGAAALMAATRSDVFHGTLALMILTTLDGLGTLHGYGIARRIEQISGNQIELNQGTLYPALLKLEQIGWITSKWGVSENNRRARYYAISRAGRKQLTAEAANWSRATDIIERFLKPLEDLA
jgi:PadR family transcriptional regulator PadR